MPRPPRAHDVTLTQLRYFIEAANTLSMTDAATNLFIAQSAVSSAIAQLERQVGAQLFIRQRSKGLVLTGTGQQFLGRARTILLSLDEAIDSARGVDSQLRGKIRIGCFFTLAPFILPALVAAVREQHPGIDIEVDEVDAEGARDALHTGRIELLINYDFNLGSEIHKTVLANIPPHIILAADHPLANKADVFLRELSREPMVLMDLPHSREYFLGILAAVGLQPHIRFRTTNFETVRSFVAHGHGFSILNLRPQHDLSYDLHRVAMLNIADDLPPLPVVLAVMSTTRATARARAVAKCAQQVVPELLSTPNA